ncbi:MAG TPA: hypothetical protein VL973_03090, partial [Sphingomonas sp.]|nr:hypothetical protein [Sphingomonas sp.]
MPRRGRVPLGIALALLAGLLVLWSQRRPIAEGFIARELAARGVRARYDVAEIGTSMQRIENLVIGDPARPDLVADWIEIRTKLGFGAPDVTGIVAGRVRMRAAWRDGRLSLGALDRLMPPPSGKPFALPELDLTISDGRARIETPAGVLGARLSGQGALNDGFRGRLALVSERLAASGCTAQAVEAAMGIAVRARAIALTGPIRAANAACGDNEARGIGATVDVQLPEALDRWAGSARLRADRIAAAGVRAAGLGGTIRFDGAPAGISGRGDLMLAGVRAGRAEATGLSFAGPFRWDGERMRLAGRIGAGRVVPGAGGVDLR